jgi:dipeptidase E
MPFFLKRDPLKKQIIALGGGGFSMEPDNPVLDRYILKQCKQSHPKICFLPTASGESQEYILKFFTAFNSLQCQPSYLSLFRLPKKDLRGFIMEKDIVYVGGGNTRSMLALWREWKLDEILQEAYQAGIILAGISAGGNCWFEQCSTDSVPGELGMLPALGFLPGSFTPHYDGEAGRRPVLHQMLLEQHIKPGYAVDNSAALHFINGQLHQAIHSVPTAQAYTVAIENNAILETPLTMLDAW